jgi:putative spermidine/putrescine transport system substrate-binding protein
MARTLRSIVTAGGIEMTRMRRTLQGMGTRGAAVLLLLTMLAAPAIARETLVIANWGGIFGESLEKNVLAGFRKAHPDVDIVIHSQSSAADTLTKIRAERAKPTIDIAFTTWAGAASLAKEGLTEPLPPADVPGLSQIVPKLLGREGDSLAWVGINPKSRGFAIKRDIAPTGPLTTKWLLDPKLRRQIAVPQFGWGNGAILLEFAMANGGSERNVDPGFAFAKQVAPNVNVIYRTTGEAVRLMTTGEASVAYVNSNAAASLAEKDPSIGYYYPTDTPLFLDADAVVVVKGGPAGRKVALEFMRYFLQPVQLDAYSFGTGSSSPNMKAPVPPKDKVPFPVDPAALSKAFFPTGETADHITRNFDAWNERWNREVVPLFGK